MEFIFRINNEVTFKSKVHSFRCSDNTKKGSQCKRHTVIGSPFCATHLLYNHNLKVKKSLIPNSGLGLFAVDPFDSTHKHVLFKKGEKIAKYYGEIIDKDELINRYEDKTPPYVIGISNNRYEDGAVKRGIGSLANTLPNHNNATISIHNGYASLKCSKNIKNGDEIYLSYGKSYKLNQPNVNYETKKIKNK